MKNKIDIKNLRVIPKAILLAPIVKRFFLRLPIGMTKEKSKGIGLIVGTTVILGILNSCERPLSDQAVFATLNQTAEVYTDAPVGMGTNFYFPFAGSKQTAFSVDSETAYESKTSIRVDVPNASDPEGNFAGAIFRIDGTGRDLTRFDALTFWAKASQGVSIDKIGFGQDFGENKFEVTRANLSLGTKWKKYIIPIPDPAKLVNERGMLWYSTGTTNTNGNGYTFWLDEVKFEKLGTLAQANPKILNGNSTNQEAFLNIPVSLSGLTYTVNGPSGENITVEPKPNYFNFKSSQPGVANVNEKGIVTIAQTGSAMITAFLANIKAEGQLNLTISGGFDFAPAPPTRTSENVISIFSDAYTNQSLQYTNGFFTPDGQTTTGGSVDVNNEKVIRYNQLNFVALKTSNRVNVTGMTNIHVDIKVEDASIDSGDFIRFILLAQNPDGTENEANVTFSDAELKAGEWVSFDKPLTDFSGVNLENISLIFFVSDAKISSISVDNIYFYK